MSFCDLSTTVYIENYHASIERFDHSKGIASSLKSRKERQYNVQKINDKRTIAISLKSR